MKKDNWENIFKNQARDNAVTPPEHIWDNVELTLEKKKWRFLFIFWILAGIVIIVSGSGYFLMKDRSNEAIVLNNQIVNVNKNESPISSKDEKMTIDAKSSERAENGIMKQTKSSGNEKKVYFNSSIDIPIKTVRKSIITKENNNAKTTFAKKQNSSEEKVASIGKSSASDTSQKTDSGKKISEDKEVKQMGFESNLTVEDVVKNVKDARAVVQTEIEAAKEVDKSSGAATVKNVFCLLTELSPYSIEPLVADDLSFYLINFPKNVKCYTFNKKKIATYVQLEGGLGLTRRKLTYTGAEPSKLYANKLATEKPWYAYNASVHFGLILKNNMILQSGINYTEIKDKFDYSESGITRIIINLDLQTGQPIDTFLETGSIINSGENRFRMINIPVSIGLQKKMKNWIIAGEVGAGINLTLTASGKFLNYDNNVLYLDDQNYPYKKRIGLSINAAFALHYLLTEKVSIYVKPQYVMTTKSLSLSNSSFNVNYDIINVNVGIRKCF